MFNRLRDPNGRFTPLANALALFVLAGLSLPLVRTPFVFVPIALTVAGVVALVIWKRRESRDRYDLRTLFDGHGPEQEEPHLDAIPAGEASSPYCGWCDECYPPGTHRCPRCSREL